MICGGAVYKYTLKLSGEGWGGRVENLLDNVRIFRAKNRHTRVGFHSVPQLSKSKGHKRVMDYFELYPPISCYIK